MLEEELIDLMTFCLQNPESNEVERKKQRITEIGKELYADGGLDALENFFFVISLDFMLKLDKILWTSYA